MPLIRVALALPAREAAAAALALETALEGEGVVVGREELDEAAGLWTVDALFEDADAAEAEVAVRTALGDLGAGLTLDVGELDPGTNWVRLSLDVLRPVEAGRFYVHGSHDRHRAAARAVPIEIDAALAFGTGHHATTWGCLVLLDRLIRRERPRRVLDIGTGTGVLAIAVARAVRSPVVATDIDPVATETARTNARLNGVAPLVRCATAAGTDHPLIRGHAPYDLVLANILARPLIELAGPASALVAPGGVVVLSGLRAIEIRRVAAAWRARGLVPSAQVVRDGWAAISLRKPRRKDASGMPGGTLRRPASMHGGVAAAVEP